MVVMLKLLFILFAFITLPAIAQVPIHIFDSLNPMDFKQTKEQIKDDSFNKSCLTLAKQVVSGNGMNAVQITEVCKFFSFEGNALDFAKYAYQYCTEPDKFYLVNEAFKFDSFKRELNKFIK